MAENNNNHGKPTSFQEDEDSDLNSWQSTEFDSGSGDQLDFQKMDDLSYPGFPSMVDRIPPTLVVADQRQLQQQIEQQEEIMHLAGQTFSNCMFYQFKFSAVGVATGAFYSLRVAQARGSVIPVAWGTVVGSALDLFWGYTVDCADKIKNFEDEREKLRRLRMKTVSYGIRK